VKQDRVVVISGAAGGIGSVLVGRFLANGDTVIATDATKEHLEQLVSSRNAGQRLITSRRTSLPSTSVLSWQTSPARLPAGLTSWSTAPATSPFSPSKRCQPQTGAA
jgi:NAD(P)-dependent dehydrogenase (short-subunit alcohol dehydrogenase family)